MVCRSRPAQKGRLRLRNPVIFFSWLSRIYFLASHPALGSVADPDPHLKSFHGFAWTDADPGGKKA